MSGAILGIVARPLLEALMQRRELSEHAKTDLADAQVLAAMPGFGGPRLDPVHMPPGAMHSTGS